MKSILYLKFFVVYLIFGFLGIFIVATLSSELMYQYIEEEEITNLSLQVNILGEDMLADYFNEETGEFNIGSSSYIKLLFQGVRNSLNASVWLVNNKGLLLYSSNTSETIAPSFIEEFNPLEWKSDLVLMGQYHNYLSEYSLSVIAPVTKGFYTMGYVLIHKSYEDIEIAHRAAMEIIYITLSWVYLLSFCFLLAFHGLVYVPLRKITEAAKQYASGNLSYEIEVQTHDEMGYLSASLNYMSNQLKDMEDYQKKFIGNVSHDFRSPLTSIRGYIVALSDGTIPPELHEKYFNIILYETERLTDLTQDLLTLNEFDTKELLLNKENFDLHEMIKKVASSFEGTCVNKKISIELLLASKYLSVNGDKRKIQQVLYNLIDNGIKFSELNSSIIIETSEINDKVFISIKDSGEGIPKENLNKIWERFYKSDLSRGKEKKGTGLGLAIVKEIIQAHNEHINVISTEGIGTEFIFSLPRVRTNDSH